RPLPGRRLGTGGGADADGTGHGLPADAGAAGRPGYAVLSSAPVDRRRYRTGPAGQEPARPDRAAALAAIAGRRLSGQGGGQPRPAKSPRRRACFGARAGSSDGDGLNFRRPTPSSRVSRGAASMSFTEAELRSALSRIIDPNTGKDLVSGNSVKNIRIDGRDVSVDVELGYPAKSQLDPIRKAVIAGIRELPGVGAVTANVYQKIVPHSGQRGVRTLPNVKNIIAVASGKGGVGKSTTAVNLALALAAEGANVGMLDADIYGPSQPTMLGISGRPESRDGKKLEPMYGHGLQASSIGFLIDPDTPMVWRGPMVTQ